MHHAPQVILDQHGPACKSLVTGRWLIHHPVGYPRGHSAYPCLICRLHSLYYGTVNVSLWQQIHAVVATVTFWAIVSITQVCHGLDMATLRAWPDGNAYVYPARLFYADTNKHSLPLLPLLLQSKAPMPHSASMVIYVISCINIIIFCFNHNIQDTA